MGLVGRKFNSTKNVVDAKRAAKERMLQAVYAAGSKSDERAKGTMRQTLKANLAKNMKNAEGNLTAGAAPHKNLWKESSDMMGGMAANSTDVGSMV